MPSLLALSMLGSGCIDAGDADIALAPPALAQQAPDASIGGGAAPFSRDRACYSRGGILFRGDPGNYHTSETYDYIALRDLTVFGNLQTGERRPAQGHVISLVEVGAPCSKASGSECTKQLSEIPPVPLLCSATNTFGYCLERQVVTTRGDEARYWSGREEVLALLAPIDTLDEASLILNYAGYELQCGHAAAAKVDGSGIEVEAIAFAGNWAQLSGARSLVKVTPDGEVTVLRSSP